MSEKHTAIPESIAKAIHKSAKSFKDDSHRRDNNGIDGLAKKIGVNPQTFSNKCNPKQESHIPNILDILNIMDQTKNHSIIDQIARQYGYVCMPIADYTGVSDMDLLNAWAAWGAERGETEQAIQKALENGDISKEEFKEIKNEMFEDFQKELALLARLKYLVSEK